MRKFRSDDSGSSGNIPRPGQQQIGFSGLVVGKDDDHALARGGRAGRINGPAAPGTELTVVYCVV